jgi:hypothetical protein
VKPPRTQARLRSLALAALRAAATRLAELRTLTADGDERELLLARLHQLFALDRALARRK